MKFRIILVLFLAFVFTGSLVTSNVAMAKRTKSQAELDAAKKEGDQSQAEVEKAQAAFLAEAEAANVDGWGDGTKTKGTGSGHSTYGVAGFDYLTGVGKVASSPGKIGADLPAALGGGKLTSQNKSPLAASIEKRFTNKWTGQLGDTESGWAEKSGVTEVWFRKHDSGSKLGGDYNEWVNQWNNITRPRHDGKTPIPGTDPDQGAHWFSVYCVHCHGWTGKGDGPTAADLDPRPRNLTNGKYTNYIDNLEMFKVIKGGGEARNLSSAMPPWGNIMQDQDIWNTVSFIRTLAAKPAYELDPDDVTAANSRESSAFNEMNEEMELEGVMAGRGGGLEGGYNSIGGGRMASKRVGVDVKTTSDSNPDAKVGDWAETTQYDK
ncbi:MAG: c-type cytochrome [Nitrospinota bacterium]|nr:c-type cytochrome [Nitrospinota bacterium]